MGGRNLGTFGAFIFLAFATLLPVAASNAQTPPPPSPFVLHQSEVQRQLSALPVTPGGLFAVPQADAKPNTRAIESAQSAGGKRGVKRARSADINPVYLRRMLGAEKLALADGNKVTSQSSQFALNLFDDVTANVVLLDSSINALGLTILRGTVVGGGSTILVIDNGKVTAQVSTSTGSFTIMPQADGTHRVVEIDRSTRHENHDDGIRPPRDPNIPKRQPGASTLEKKVTSKSLPLAPISPY